MSTGCVRPPGRGVSLVARPYCPREPLATPLPASAGRGKCLHELLVACTWRMSLRRLAALAIGRVGLTALAWPRK
ncbi:hypothetical protein Dimus_013630, partial [Dionaea muscipula]